MPGSDRGVNATGIDLAVQDLSRRLSVAATQIRVKSQEEVEWNDASLGCPQPGAMYAQVITPGYRVILEANGQEYDYHGSGSRVILCEKGQPSGTK